MTTNAFASPFQQFDVENLSKYFTVPSSVTEFARESMSVSTESTRASVKGMQDAGSTVMRQMKDQMTLSVEAGKKLAEAATIEDAVSIQSAYIKSAIEANMKGFTELSTLYADTFREAYAPIAKKAKKVTKKAKKAA